jgi:hypothetical protein
MVEGEQTQGPDELAGFVLFVTMCANSEDFVREFDRLCKTNLGRRGSPIELAIDDACERPKHDARMFIDFCRDIWDMTPRATQVEFCEAAVNSEPGSTGSSDLRR